MALDFPIIEAKWQKAWRDAKTFQPAADASKKKYLITIPIPYANGSPHVGHAFSFARTDVYARYKRSQGFNVLFPQGFHITGQPILGVVDRLKANDQTQINTLKISGASDADIERFKQKGPEEVAKFFIAKWKKGLNSLGSSIDWTREFTTTQLNPTFSRFIEWQYNTLRKKGYVVQGTHPVVYCRFEESPIGDHDRLKGEGESPIEYTLIKFKTKIDGDEFIIPCATLRPETVYAVTNLWVNPHTEYLLCEVTQGKNKELWLVSPDAVHKLQDQKKKITIKKHVKGHALIGQHATNPVNNSQVLILPAEFVDQTHATGLVMSVPAHAPYDYVALRDLQENEDEARHWKLDVASLKSIRPIQMINVDSYNGAPAVEEVENRRVKNQKDEEALEAATSQVYKEEFHKGVLNEKTGEYKGKNVSEAKELIAQSLKNKNLADSMWETTAPVICRSGHKCYVKILENQWFLKFSDEKWKAQAKAHIKTMKVYPEEARAQLENTVDWLKDKACARKTGLGTPLPWDKEWLVETLSDSTIYMAYYTLARVVTENKIKAEQLTDEIFDFIFRNEGKLDDVKKKTTLKPELIAKLKQEFEYFYPCDMRSSGKDLVQNHMTFYIFHHVALFPQKFWPQGAAINGYVNVEGQKMSKSLGNIIPAEELVRDYGADVTRLTLAASADGLNDADWRKENTKTNRKLLEYLHDTSTALAKITNPKDYHALEKPEKILESRINKALRHAAQAYEQFELRSASQNSLYETTSAIKQYLETRNGINNANAAVLKRALENATIAIAPFAPHFAEENWHALGHADLASTAPFPNIDESKIDASLELEQSFIDGVIEDAKNVTALMKTKPKALVVYVTPEWKWELLQTAIASGKASGGKIDFNTLMKQAMQQQALKSKAVEVQAFLMNVSKNFSFYVHAQKIDEQDALADNAQRVEKALDTKLLVIRAEDANAQNDPKGKAGRAMPLKPALYLE
ncbi:MAG TPA: leucine--tRNA ligase [Candidatus Norongarragalinales archaeon]|jgi:leucyl-tRNA synthetase|nr:leucine--tRNA ligase [Candidatus Norongarragalinales archaeon]